MVDCRNCGKLAHGDYEEETGEDYDTLESILWALSQCLQHLQNRKWLPGGPKMADGVWKGF